MSYNKRDLDGIKKSLQQDIDRMQAQRDLWRAVTYPVTKSGQPFKVLSKNINGARLTTNDYSFRQGENILKVSGRTARGEWVKDSIYCYANYEDMRQDDHRKEKIQNLQPKASIYTKQVYTYDIEDIKQAVNDRIKQLDKYIESYKKQLAVADAIFNDFRRAYYKAMDDLKRAAGVSDSGIPEHIYYLVRDTVRERYPYV